MDNDIVFVKTRYDYQSYTDYWTLVQLAGFPICYVDEIDKDDGRYYIISPKNGEIDEYIANNVPYLYDVKSKFILWNLERPGGSGSIEKYISDNTKLLDSHFHYIAVADKAMAKFGSFVYMPIGLEEDFCAETITSQEKEYDLIHLSCYSDNRRELFLYPDTLKDSYKGYSVASNGWGVKRHNLLVKSKCMLNIHQDGHPFVEPLRFVVAIAYGLPIITEKCIDFGIYEKTFSGEVYPILLNDIHDAMLNYPVLYDRALGYREYFLHSYNYRHVIESAVYNI